MLRIFYLEIPFQTAMNFQINQSCKICVHRDLTISFLPFDSDAWGNGQAKTIKQNVGHFTR